MQSASRIGVFACDESAIYSDRTIRLAPGGLETRKVDLDFGCPGEGECSAPLNGSSLIAVWRAVAQDGRFASHDWTVKVDPATVFFPDRLGRSLETYQDAQQGLFLKSCKNGMHGALEVLSMRAVAAFVVGSRHCAEHSQELEDVFTDHCLSEVLGVRRIDVANVLVQGQCDPPDNWESCLDGTSASFHPFRTVESYQLCWVCARSSSASSQPFKAQESYELCLTNVPPELDVELPSLAFTPT